MSELKKYSGSCHCGTVKYEVELDLTGGVVSCNCSICRRTGTLLAFTGKDQFKLASGEENVADYQFNKKQIHHLFCKNCGVRSYARGVTPDGRPMVAINVRCIDDVDLDSLKINHFDGKHV